MKKIIFLKLLEKLLKPFLPNYLQDDKIIKKIISLYQKNEFTAIFAKLRFWDAPFREIEKVIPREAKILDLGCGDGIFANYLAITGPKRKITGIEINRDRLKEANKRLKNTRFLTGDVLKTNIPKVDVITMIHLLHHLPSKKSQEELIGKVYQKLEPGGKLIIAEVAEKPFPKFVLSWIVDVFIVPILFQGKLFSGQIFYRKNCQWNKLLLNYGFKVKFISLHKNKPFSHSLFIATKT